MWWVVLFLFSISCCSAAAPARTNRIQKQHIMKSKKTVEPIKPDPSLRGELIYAKGEGAIASAAKEPNRAKAYLDARNHAIMQATANLLMALDGTSIYYSATGRGFTAGESIEQRIEGFVRSVRIVKEREKRIGNDRIVEVTIAAPVGSAGPSSITMHESEEVIIETSEIVERDEPAIEEEQTACHTRKFPETGYTSLIVDATGTMLSRSMSPKIRRQDGSEVWGTVEVSYAVVQEEGIVGYAKTMEEALRNRRAGPRPLIIRAIGAISGPFPSDPVVSNEDAELILQANKRSGFLDSFNVIFVTGAPAPTRALPRKLLAF